MTSKVNIQGKADKADCGIFYDDTIRIPGRKRKLDHLTSEERVQRKKLKNRVAAQTSRDRKKKQMEEMQETIEEQSKLIVTLERKCDHLSEERDRIQLKLEKIEKEYQSLISSRNIKKEIIHNIPEEHKYTRSAIEEEIESCVGFFPMEHKGSAESTPLPKVTNMEKKSTELSTKNRNQKKNDVNLLLKVIILCLLYKNSSKTSNSTSSILNNLQRVYLKKSQQTWSKILRQVKLQMPEVTSSSSPSNHWWGPKTKVWNPPKIKVL